VLHATPIKIPEPSFLQICAASQWLCAGPDRDAFWLRVRAELEALPELGEGVIARSIAGAFKTFYRPIEVPLEPLQLRKLDVGSRKLEAKFEALEAHRVRRPRRWS
jgi:hypothetical protein